MPYKEAFPKGSRVRIASKHCLEDFMASWKYHHRLQPEQVNFADQVATVEGVAFYHGGDPLYTLANIPGFWHEQCLLPE